MKYLITTIMAALFSMSIVAHADDLSDRKALMKSLNGYLKILNGQKSSYDAATVSKEAGNAVAAFEQLQSLFTEKGTGETKASDAIWSDAAGFSGSMADALEAAKNMKSNADNGAENMFGDDFGQLAQSCGGCHRNFRERR